MIISHDWPQVVTVTTTKRYYDMIFMRANEIDGAYLYDLQLTEIEQCCSKSL